MINILGDDIDMGMGVDDAEENIGHAFQFQVWKKALDVKYNFELIWILIFSFIMLYYANNLIDNETSINESYAKLTDLQSMNATNNINSQIDQLYALMKDQTYEYFYNLYILMILSILSIAYFLSNVQEIIYANLRGVFVEVLSAEFMLNLSNSILVIYWVLNHYLSFTSNLSDYRYELRAYIIIQRMNDAAYFNLKIWNAANIALQFSRLVFSLQVSKTFGPMVKILASMLLNVAIFMLLFAALFLIFNAIGQLVFQELDGFSSPIQTAITLFSACLGNFDYNIFNKLTVVSPYFGHIFMTIFLIFTMIMLLNFLIAILSNIYANLNDVQIGLYLRKVLFLRQRCGYDNRYSSMIYAIPPLNIIVFLLIPFIVYWNSKKLNRFLLSFMYIPICLTAVVLFTLLQLFMIPITYTLIIISKAWNLPIKPIFGWKDLSLRILDLTVFIFVGPGILLFWVCIDFINFVFKLYDTNIVTISTHEEETQEKINKQMDGSIRYKDGMQNKAEDQTVSFRSVNKVLNPIKEGLAENTLKIMKAWIKTTKDSHFAVVGKMDKDSFKYLPTSWIIIELKEVFMIQEQINVLLYGVSYNKNEEFLKSEKFDKIIESLLEFEKKAISIDAEDSEGDSDDHEEIEDSSIKNKSGSQISSIQRRDEIALEIKLFLSKSNEKWILDQYNLWKRFLITNSIEGHYDDFSHPVYQQFKHIKWMKEKWWDAKAVGKNYNTFSNIVQLTQSGVMDTLIRK